MSIHFMGEKKTKAQECKTGLPKDLVNNSESRGGINAEFNLILLFLFIYFFKEYLFGCPGS